MKYDVFVLRAGGGCMLCEFSISSIVGGHVSTALPAVDVSGMVIQEGLGPYEVGHV